MTKIEALTKALEMWEWLAQNSSSSSNYLDKLRYFNKICAPTFEDCPINGCFLCEYCYKDGLVHCGECLVQWTPIIQDGGVEEMYCQRTCSPYEGWRLAESEEVKREYAGEVADLIRTALEQEKRNEECN